MREFFHGWRRKIGAAMLVMACLFGTGWVRSRPIQDTLTIETGESSTVKVLSVGQCLIFVKTTAVNADGPNRVRWWSSHRVIEDGWQLLNHNSMTQRDILPFRLDRFDYQIGGGKYSATSFPLPYWAIVIPLTLLSAYLLLSNPRPPKLT